MVTTQSIAVIVSSEQPRKGNTDLPVYAAPYISEILRHAGIPFSLLPPDALVAGSSSALQWRTQQTGSPRLLILAQDLDLNADQKAGAAAFVESGGALIGIAGASGLDGLFGVRTDGFLDEGYLRPPSETHPVTAGLRREIHVFGGSRVTATTGAALSQVRTGEPPILGLGCPSDRPTLPAPGTDNSSADAVVAHTSGRGRTLLIAPDLITSVVHIQQGKPVTPAAPRESTGTPQGSILDPDRDGDIVEIDALDDLYYSHAARGEDGRPHYNRRVLLTPMADVLRELLLRAIFHLFSSAGETLPVLWYWPRGLHSIAHMSHDSDGNRQSLAWSLYELLHSLDAPSTWCTMPVSGYTRAFYNALQQSDSEIALHYATGNAPLREDRRWSQMDFDWQYDTLCYETRLSRIVSNKNHGLAWQGRLEFYRWCQAKGIQIEQSRGDRGFTFGTSHPWLPMQDDRPGGEFIDVLALCFLTQDLTVVCPHGFMRPLADQCHAAYGVAHFLFHPTHIEDPECERAIRETVAYTRSLGMEWWTSAAINTWERARRRAAITQGEGASAGGRAYLIQAPDSLPQATLLFLLPASGNPPALTLDGEAVSSLSVERYGHRFAQIAVDLCGEHEIGMRFGEE